MQTVPNMQIIRNKKSIRNKNGKSRAQKRAHYGILLLGCLLLFTACGRGGAPKSGTTQETTVPMEDTNAQTKETTAQGNDTTVPGQTDTEPEQTQAEEVRLTETDQRIMKSLVQIRAGELQGSGVVYDEKENFLLIVTAGHVLAQAPTEITVTFPDGTQAAAAEAETADNCDLAFLWVDKEALSQEPLSQETGKSCLPVQTDRDVFDTMKAYDDVWMYGGESGAPVYAFVVDPWIYVEDFDQYMLLLQGLATPGMSGGGVFTEDGVFLGIICGADEEGKVAVVPYSMVETERAGR